jgi:phosphatidylglycerophosphate synthase
MFDRFEGRVSLGAGCVGVGHLSAARLERLGMTQQAQAEVSQPEQPQTARGLPPFSSVLKSREVEDPVNLWFNRPLAYAFVALVFRTPITPNQVTLLATVVGLIAAAGIAWGTAEAMLWGGILLWTSAILDGADGILARAKKLQSDMGRALDGTADLVVAGAAIVAAIHHLWLKYHSVEIFVLCVATVMTSVFHIYLYDYYKESYLTFTRTEGEGKFETRVEVEERLQRFRREKASWVVRLAAKLYVDLLRNQHFAVSRTNPAGLREGLIYKLSPDLAAIYRRHNRGPMWLWTWISLAPHTYLMAIFAMLDRLEIYLWIRLVLANALLLAALLWQRRASNAVAPALVRALVPNPFSLGEKGT